MKNNSEMRDNSDKIFEFRPIMLFFVETIMIQSIVIRELNGAREE